MSKNRNYKIGFRLHNIFRGPNFALLFFTAFFLLNAVLGYYAISNIENRQSRVNLALNNIILIEELFVEALRAESGQRGFLLTELETYLTPYSQALTLIRGKLFALKTTELDPAQITRFQNLETLINAKLVELEETIVSVRENRDIEAIQGIFTHRGRNLMQEISKIVENMELHERSELFDRQSTVSEARLTAFYLILASNLVGLMMVFISYNLLKKAQMADDKYTVSLQEANDTLELKVDERTHALQHFSNELKRSNRELQDFAFVASHDLQEPLRKIKAFGGQLQKHYAHILDAKGSNYIERMYRASERMSALITDLLAFSRITTQTVPFVKIDLDKILEETIDDLEIAIQESDAKIAQSKLTPIEADAFQIKQLFQNLISNALKFRKEDVSPVIKISGKITLPPQGYDAEDIWQEIKFEDNGIGFDQGYANKIFTPFQRLHNKSEYSGTGIGLAICRRIIDRHGGEISVSSAVGKGTVFTLKLPVKHISVKTDDIF